MTYVLPVIHHESDALALEQAIIAHSLGADGIFLISHHNKDKNLPPLALQIKNKFPAFKVGINLLSQDILSAAQTAHHFGLDMVWGDCCGVSSKGLNQQGLVLSNWIKEHKGLEVFASVAFKYQPEDLNPALAAEMALKNGFIPTTSGAGTGSAPSVEKIRTMSFPVQGTLAVASGMTCDNVKHFSPYLSHILVSTGVSKDDYRFDIDKLASFINYTKESVQ